MDSIYVTLLFLLNAEQQEIVTEVFRKQFYKYLEKMLIKILWIVKTQTQPQLNL